MPGRVGNRWGRAPHHRSQCLLREGGAILPLGSTAANGVHKGFGLLLLSDILTGLLSGDGGACSAGRASTVTPSARLRIDAFPTGGAFKDLMDEMVEKLHATPNREGAGSPGTPVNEKS